MAKAKSFEESMDELEKIVSELESGESSLDDSLKLFEQGMKLSKNCQGMLDRAAQKVTVLLEDSEGKPIEEKFVENEE